jgi:hypothetical protein
MQRIEKAVTTGEPQILNGYSSARQVSYSGVKLASNLRLSEIKNAY